MRTSQRGKVKQGRPLGHHRTDPGFGGYNLCVSGLAGAAAGGDEAPRAFELGSVISDGRFVDSSRAQMPQGSF